MQLWNVKASVYPLEANVSRSTLSPGSTISNGAVIKVVADSEVFWRKRKRQLRRDTFRSEAAQTKQTRIQRTSNVCCILPYAVVTHVYPRLLRKTLMRRCTFCGRGWGQLCYSVLSYRVWEERAFLLVSRSLRWDLIGGCPCLPSLLPLKRDACHAWKAKPVVTEKINTKCFLTSNHDNKRKQNEHLYTIIVHVVHLLKSNSF